MKTVHLKENDGMCSQGLKMSTTSVSGSTGHGGGGGYYGKRVGGGGG